MRDTIEDETDIEGEFISGEKVKAIATAETLPVADVSVDMALDLDSIDQTSRYVREHLLGVGGMAEVHLCKDLVTGRHVAMKVMDVQRAGNPEISARFLREARVQAQLQHPAIVPVYDMGEDTMGGRFFTMQRVTGVTLDAVLEELAGGNRTVAAEFPRNKLINVFQRLCLAIVYAHSRGVIHRDIKPGNVMLGEHGELYVLDWGLAKVASETSAVDIDDAESANTLEGQVLGTPGYMAPEQAISANQVDERADVYALGAVLFEILALEPLHSGASLRALLRSTQRGADARPSVRAPKRDVPPELEAICVRATAHDPLERHSTVRELHSELERYMEGHRDVELRRDLALRHAEAAEEAAIRAIATPEASVHRSRALEEAGRALALDPDSRGAHRVLVALLLELPSQLPAEVTAEIEDAAVRELRLANAFGAVIYGLLFFGALVYLAWFGKTWIGAALILVPLGAAVAACSNALRRRFTHHNLNTVCVSFLVSLAIGSASSLYGPLILVPTLVTANAAALSILIQKAYRPIHLAFSCAAICVPFALEWAGLMPRSYEFIGNTIRVTSEVVHFTPTSVPIGLLLFTVVAIMAPNVMTAHWSNALKEVRRRLHMQMWHLEQLAPGRKLA